MQGVAKQLRMCGVDAAMIDPAAGPPGTYHRRLVECAEEEGRVILTGDGKLSRARYSDLVYQVTVGGGAGHPDGRWEALAVFRPCVPING